MNVCIIQPVMKGYRFPFFVGLAERLSQSDITLKVAYGKPWAEEKSRADHVALAPPLGLEVKSIMLPGNILFQSFISPWLMADLVIVEHANKHALNHLLSLLWAVGIKRLAYWGHGQNHQGIPNSFSEMFKRGSLHWADWWFAYTSDSGKYLNNQGFDPNRITVVENAIDTRVLREELDSITDAERKDVLSELGFDSKSRVGIFCGSLYANKRLDILLGSADKVHTQFQEFRLIIVGAGPNSDEVVSYTNNRPWIKYVGPKFGRDKSILLSISEFFLNPGLVGLSILDAFCAGLPFLTTDIPLHSPEIEYLNHGRNGLMLAPTIDSFASGIVTLLQDSTLLNYMLECAHIDGHRYSIETMIENFAIGVEQCLAL